MAKRAIPLAYGLVESLCLAVGISLARAVPPAPPPATIYANIPAVDRGIGVIGRDDGLSILVGSNCCFFFGDTVLTQANAQGSSWVVNTMYHTTNTDGDTGVSGGYNWLSNGVPPLQFIPYTPDETNWNATNAGRYVYGIWPNSQFYSPGDSNQYITIGKVIETTDIPDIGAGLAICPTNPLSSQATRVLSRPGNAQPYLMWDSTEGDWGDMCCTMSNYVYFYWVNGTNYGTLYVARASLLGSPPAFLTKTNWQYWNGTTWVTNNPAAAAYILGGIGSGTIDWNAFLTNDSGGRGCYLFTCMEWVSTNIFTYASSDLVHWSAATAQYAVNWSNFPSGSFPYFGRAVKCLEKNNGQTIYITWSLPNTNIFAPENMPMLRAEFPKVNPVFAGLTPSQAIGYGNSSIILSGTLSANGAYPARGETITVTIDGTAQPATVNDSTGDFSINYNPSTVPVSGVYYAITYSYAGDGALNAADNALTKLTVTNPPPVTGAIALQTNGAVRLVFAGNPNTAYVVQVATNLLGPWHPASTNTAGQDGSWQFVDYSTTNAQRFYRAAAIR
jgi:hypothetical protein